MIRAEAAWDINKILVMFDDQYIYNGSFELTVEQALELSQRLIRAVDEYKKIDKSYSDYVEGKQECLKT